MKQTIKTILIAVLTAFLGVSCQQKPADVFQRDTDQISVDCNSQSVKHYVLVSGHWTLETDEDWLHFNPSEGDGDGVLFQPYEIQVDHNKGDAREGVFYLCHNGQRASVIVSQNACNFRFGAVSFAGSLVKGETSTATILVEYTGASGDESADYSCVLSGTGAAGLSIPAGTYSAFTAGKGNMVIPVSGTPEAVGDLTIDVTVNGKALGQVAATVAAPSSGPGTSTRTLAKWSFEEAANSEKAAEYAALYPSWASSKTLDAMEGSGKISIVEAAGKTAKAVNSASFSGGHLYWKGMYVDDAVLFTIPASCDESAEFEISGCMGGSGSSAGYFLVEYSSDGSNWTVAPDAQTETVNGTAVKYHCAPADNTTDVNVGTFKARFSLGKAVSDKFYIRMRVSADVRINHSSTVAITTGGGGSTRFKGDITINCSEQGGSYDFTGFPVGWNFYALGLDGPGAVATEQAKHWVKDSALSEYYVPATMGTNSGAIMTAVGNITNHTFNPSIQCQGLLEGDYWLMTIPVTGMSEGTKLKIEMGCGGSGGSVGFYILEYSTNATSWTEVPGAVDQTRGENTFKAHLWNTPSSISTSGYTNTRKSYDKTIDDTYRTYEFEAPALTVGNLYFRLRVLKYRATKDSTADVSAGWTDIKGFEVSIVK